MIRKIITINEEKCNGCGLCAEACHEGAIGMVNGKAKLLRDDYCDGLGDCLPACPTGAITFEEREAADYDEAAVEAHKAKRAAAKFKAKESGAADASGSAAATDAANAAGFPTPIESQLANWPVQIKLCLLYTSVPCRPTIMYTVNPFGEKVSLLPVPPISSVRSSFTILITC